MFYLVSALSDPGYVTTYVLNEYEDDIENMKNYASEKNATLSDSNARKQKHKIKKVIFLSRIIMIKVRSVKSIYQAK